MPATTGGNRAVRLRFRLWIIALGACLAVPGMARGQVIRGTVVDVTTKSPVSQATVSFRREGDSTLQSVATTSGGRFLATLKRPGTYAIIVRHLGYAELMTTAATLVAGDTVTIALEIARLPVALDTVVSVDSSSVFPTTPGHEFVRLHFAKEEGIQVAGYLIEKSGQSLSQYLGTHVPGIHITDLIQPFNPNAPTRLSPPAVPADGGRFLMADSGSQCLYARVDRYSLIFLLHSDDAETIDELLPVKSIMAVEVFRSPREVPPEWKSVAEVSTLFQRRNNGEYYLIGDTGFPSLNVGALQDQKLAQIGGFLADSNAAVGAGATGIPGRVVSDTGLRILPKNVAGLYDLDEYGLQPVPNTLSAPVCAFLQIWTHTAW